MPVKCKNFDVCGNYKPPIARVKGLCNQCAAKHQATGLKDLTKVQQDIDRFEEYVRRKVEHEIETNKKVVCAECGSHITSMYLKRAFGFNVAHLIAKGTNPNAYYVRENSIFLCFKHHHQLDHGDRESMNIYDQVEKQKQYVKENLESLLTLEHNTY